MKEDKLYTKANWNIRASIIVLVVVGPIALVDCLVDLSLHHLNRLSCSTGRLRKWTVSRLPAPLTYTEVVWEELSERERKRYAEVDRLHRGYKERLMSQVNKVNHGKHRE